MDKISPIVDMLQGGFGFYNILYGDSSSNSLAGVSSASQTLIQPADPAAGFISNLHRKMVGNVSFSQGGPIIPWETRVLVLGLIISYDAAGAAADAGKRVSITLNHSTAYIPPNYAGVETVAIYQGKAQWIIAAGQLTYHFNINGAHDENTPGIQQSFPTTWSRWVPAHHKLSMQINKDDATNFPANTTFRIHIGAIQTPFNGRLPL